VSLAPAIRRLDDGAVLVEKPHVTVKYKDEP